MDTGNGHLSGLVNGRLTSLSVVGGGLSAGSQQWGVQQ